MHAQLDKENNHIRDLEAGKAFSHNDVNYPRNWIKVSSQSDKEEIGIFPILFMNVIPKNHKQVSFYDTFNGSEVGRTLITEQILSDQEMLDQEKQRLITIVKKNASTEILDFLPIYKQNNLLARAIELNDYDQITEEHLAEKMLIRQSWDTIKTIRVNCQVKCVEISTLNSLQECEEFIKTL